MGPRVGSGVYEGKGGPFQILGAAPGKHWLFSVCFTSENILPFDDAGK